MAGIMACQMALPILIVLVAAEETSSASRTQAAHSLMQSSRSIASATPASIASATPASNVSHNVSNNDHVSNNETMGPDGKKDTQVFASRTKPELNNSFRLSVLPQLLNGGFCRSHPCSLLEKKNNSDKGGILGATAEMSEEGYQSIAKLKTDEEMLTFIVRVVEDYDCHVENAGGLMGVIPWFSGTTAVQSLAKLEEALLFAVLADGERWIIYKNSAGTTGENAPLDLQGYMEIAIIREDGEMEAFARRLVHQMKVQITDEGGFKGMLRYHTGAAAFQSFDKLKSEITSAAEAPHSWAEHTNL